MHLDEAQSRLWLQQPHPPQTDQESLIRLSRTLADTLQAFESGQSVEAQSRLEDTLAATLIALKQLGIGADTAIERAESRMVAQARDPRIFHVYQDRVEIQVGTDMRGGWPLYAPEDYDNVVSMARAFGCDVHHHDSHQLDLFGRRQPTRRNRVLPRYPKKARA